MNIKKSYVAAKFVNILGFIRNYTSSFFCDREKPLLVILLMLSCLLSLARIMKYELYYYMSDFYVNLESALNVIELKKVFYSSFFGNPLGMHVSLSFLFDAIFVYFFGGYYYAVISCIILFFSIYFVNKIIIKYNEDWFLSFMLAFLFFFNPLTINLVDISIYGFQFMTYSLCLLPFLVYAIEYNKKNLFLLALAINLLFVDEAFVNICLIGLYYTIRGKEYRKYGIISLAIGGIYGLSILKIISYFSSQSSKPAVDTMKIIFNINTITGWINNLIRFNNANKLFVTHLKLYSMSGFTYLLFFIFSFIPAFPLFLILSLHIFISEFQDVWRYYYLWIMIYIFGCLHFARFIKKISFLSNKLGIFIKVLLLIIIFRNIQQFFNVEEYKINNVYNYFIKNYTKLTFAPKLRDFNEYKLRKTEIKYFKQDIVKEKNIVILPRTSLNIYNHIIRNIHHKAKKGVNFYFTSDGGGPDSTDNYFSGILKLPVAYKSDRFILYRSGFDLSVNAKKSKQKGTNIFLFEIEKDGEYIIQTFYTKDSQSWPNYSGITKFRIDQDHIEEPVCIVPTVYNDEKNASLYYLGTFYLSKGEHWLEFFPDQNTCIYSVYVDELEAKKDYIQLFS